MSQPPDPPHAPYPQPQQFAHPPQPHGSPQRPKKTAARVLGILLGVGGVLAAVFGLVRCRASVLELQATAEHVFDVCQSEETVEECGALWTGDSAELRAYIVPMSTELGGIDELVFDTTCFHSADGSSRAEVSGSVRGPGGTNPVRMVFARGDDDRWRLAGMNWAGDSYGVCSD